MIDVTATLRHGFKNWPRNKLVVRTDIFTIYSDNLASMVEARTNLS